MANTVLVSAQASCDHDRGALLSTTSVQGMSKNGSRMGRRNNGSRFSHGVSRKGEGIELLR